MLLSVDLHQATLLSAAHPKSTKKGALHPICWVAVRKMASGYTHNRMICFSLAHSIYRMDMRCMPVFQGPYLLVSANPQPSLELGNHSIRIEPSPTERFAQRLYYIGCHNNLTGRILRFGANAQWAQSILHLRISYRFWHGYIPAIILDGISSKQIARWEQRLSAPCHPGKGMEAFNAACIRQLVDAHMHGLRREEELLWNPGPVWLLFKRKP